MKQHRLTVSFAGDIQEEEVTAVVLRIGRGELSLLLSQIVQTLCEGWPPDKEQLSVPIFGKLEPVNERGEVACEAS